MVPVRYRCIRYKVPIRYLSIHVLHTVPVHVPVPYTSTGLVTGSGTAGTDTLWNGTKNGIKRYRFCTGTVLLLYRAWIAFVLGQYRFCAGSVSLLYWVNVVFVYHNSVVYLLLFTETEMSSFWWNFHHWLHWKLSKWQLSMQPVTKMPSKWQHFRFSVVPVYTSSCHVCILNIYHCRLVQKRLWYQMFTVLKW